MSDREAEFQRIVAALKAGDPVAAEELLDSFKDTLLIVLRKRVSNSIRALYDEEDALQSAMRQFFAHLVDLAFADRQQMIAYIYRLACGKLLNAHRHLLGGKNLSENGRHSLEQLPEAALTSRDPGPEEVAQRNDWWKILSEERPALCDLLRMLQAGYTQQEIAEALGITDRQVRRRLEAIRNLSALLEGFPTPDFRPSTRRKGESLSG